MGLMATTWRPTACCTQPVAEGGNSYRYELDAGGRTGRRNHGVMVASVDQWASGNLRLTGFDD